MFEYDYVRHAVNGYFDINNPERVDAEGNQIYLAEEIKTALPDKHYQIKCYDTSCKIYFAEELTTEEKETLDDTVSRHQNNT